GMFMDAIGMLILTLPVTFPAVIALNGGPDVSRQASALGMTGEECAIWFGIIVVKMAELCLITPPIGLNCFVVAGVAQEAKMPISVQDVFRGAAPFFLADVATVAVLIAFPGIVLWLPNLL
ncbi:MAG: TRAP transporter large permease subunit, partial [Pseudomonadota bacterium]